MRVLSKAAGRQRPRHVAEVEHPSVQPDAGAATSHTQPPSKHRSPTSTSSSTTSTRRATGIGVPDDVRDVLRTSYRETVVQIPVRFADGQDPRLQGLPRAAQRRARSLQGRPALPPRRRPRRGPRAGDADDVEDGDRRHPVRRRQGRRQLPQRSAAARGAAVHHALADGQDRQGARPQPGHHGARRRHERAGDGLADGRVRQAPRPHAGDRDRQADRARGLLRPRVGDRPRPRLPVSRGGPQARPVTQHRRPSSCRDSATSAPGRRGSSSSSA